MGNYSKINTVNKQKLSNTVSQTEKSNVSFGCLLSEFCYVPYIRKERDVEIKLKIGKLLNKNKKLENKIYNGDVTNEDKLSEYGYYLNLKKSKPEQNELYDYLLSNNPRKIAREYDIAYNNIKNSAQYHRKFRAYWDEDNHKFVKEPESDYNEKRLDEFFFKQKQEKNLKLISNPNKSYLNTEYAQNKMQEFADLFKEKYFYICNDKIDFVLDIIDKKLDECPKDEYLYIIEKLKQIYNEFTDPNKNQKNANSWKSLMQIAYDHYTNNILPDMSMQHEQKKQKVADFINSSNYKIMNYGNRLAMLFEYQGGGSLTLDERAFLVDK